MTEITAETKEGASVAFDYNLGVDESQEALNERFGKEVVASFGRRAIVIAAQSHARTLIKAGKTAEEIQAAMNEWKPGMPRQTISKVEKATALISTLSDDERAALLKDLKTKKAA